MWGTLGSRGGKYHGDQCLGKAAKTSGLPEDASLTPAGGVFIIPSGPQHPLNDMGGDTAAWPWHVWKKWGPAHLKHPDAN